MNPDEAAARLDKTLKRGLLSRLENIARREQEDDSAIARQVRIVEHCGVLCCIHSEAVALAEPLYSPDGGRDRVVAKARGLREHENAPLLNRRCASRGDEEDEGGACHYAERPNDRSPHLVRVRRRG